LTWEKGNNLDILPEQQIIINHITSILQKSKRILFITGAGMSADSGLPTYRGIGGLYNDGLTEDGIPIEEALSGYMMLENPEIAWKHISGIEKVCRDAKFNRGHQVIAEMEKHFESVWVLTQNVDGLHRSAGTKNIIDIHGDVHDLRCMKCPHRFSVENYSNLQIPPVCEKCGAIIRPDVVLFNEMLSYEKLNLLMKEGSKGFDIVFSVGTTSVFPYIQAPVMQAKSYGIPTVEINPGETEVSAIVEHKLHIGAAVALEVIWENYKKQ